MEKKKSLGKIFGIIVLVLALLLGGAAVAFKIYTSNYYATDSGMTSRITAEYEEQVEIYVNNDGMVFVPKDQDYRAAIVFYPGGKVEYTAYASLMCKLSSRGFVCFLTRMPENIALLGVDLVDKLMPEEAVVQKLAGIEMDWYMAGHSLGGTAASKYISGIFDEKALGDEKEVGSAPGGWGQFKGIIFCGSYPSYDLKDKPIRMLSILGSNDSVLNRNSYEESKTFWPEDTTEYVIDGGNHSYFGCYGLQNGDGIPKITNEEQLDITADVIDKWIGR